MLSEKELAFLEYWDKERDRQSGLLYKLTAGLPRAILFFLPVPLFILLVYFLLPDWYYRISNKAGSLLPTILIAMLLASVFFAVFRMHFRWEANEIYYQELKNRKN